MTEVMQKEPVGVYAAIAAVMGELSKSGISKEHKATGFATYNFRGIDDVYNALASLLSAHGLVILPRVLFRTSSERTSAKGGVVVYTTVDVEYDIVCAKDGSRHTVRTIGEAMDSGDKSTNKAMSAAYKYMAFQAFCIPTEGDNDADVTAENLPPAKQSNKPAQQQETPFDKRPDALLRHIPVPMDGEGYSDWDAWTKTVIMELNKAGTTPTLLALWNGNKAAIKESSIAVPKLHEQIGVAFATNKQRLNKAA